jgi:acyl-coenzyme A thioesterase PaaI-like protein
LRDRPALPCHQLRYDCCPGYLIERPGHDRQQAAIGRPSSGRSASRARRRRGPPTRDPRGPRGDVADRCERDLSGAGGLNSAATGGLGGRGCSCERPTAPPPPRRPLQDEVAETLAELLPEIDVEPGRRVADALLRRGHRLRAGHLHDGRIFSLAVSVSSYTCAPRVNPGGGVGPCAQTDALQRKDVASRATPVRTRIIGTDLIYSRLARRRRELACASPG